jgi:hypothetical protein
LNVDEPLSTRAPDTAAGEDVAALFRQVQFLRAQGDFAGAARALAELLAPLLAAPGINTPTTVPPIALRTAARPTRLPGSDIADFIDDMLRLERPESDDRSA